jgi:methylenetetrahydrofolate dehydrogenase (NADP+)/methenyltetrahydrofolate cyclohydrolase
MTAKLIDGKKVSGEILSELKNRISKIDSNEIKPGLAVIIAGDDPASHSYVRSKVKRCNDIGIYSEKIELPDDVPAAEIIDTIQQLNSDKKIHGVLVQLPLPKHLDSDKILNNILPRKDVDGFLPQNTGLLLQDRDEGVIPCTPKGILELLKYYNIETSGKRAAILGRSNIVGRPMAALLLKKNINCTVTVCHSKTKDIKSITKGCDIVIAAIGRANFLTKDMIKEGSVLIDVGQNRTDDGLAGDIDFNDCIEKAYAITPVPGGVGPMTIAMLLQNCWENYNQLK